MMKRLLFTLVLIILLALGGALLPLDAHAHGGGVPQITGAVAGSYRLYVWTDPADPRAGDTVHVTVGVTLPAGGAAGAEETPVTDANVTVRLAPQGSGAPLEMSAAPGSVYYEADTSLPHSGNWQVSVDVSGAQGNGSAGFVLPVGEATATGYGYMALGIVIVGLGILMFVRQSRRAKARPGQASA